MCVMGFKIEFKKLMVVVGVLVFEEFDFDVVIIV